MQTSYAIESTQNQLRQWGIWLMVRSGIPRYVSPAFALMRDNVQQPCYGEPLAITDEEAEELDRAIAALRLRDERLSRCLVLYYGPHKLTYRQLGDELGVPHQQVGTLLNSAVAWVDAWISVRQVAA